MKIVRLLTLLLLFTMPAYAGLSRSVDWFVSESGRLEFEGSFKLQESILPVYRETLEPATQAPGYSVHLSYPVYQKLTEGEQLLLKNAAEQLPDTLALTLRKGSSRKKAVLDLEFVPLVRRKDGIYKLISFNLEIAPVSASAGLRSVSSTTSYAAHSVLASGRWVKLSVTESGMYKLTYSDIRKMGIDPANVQIYGYGGKLLQEDFSLPGYQDDLPAVALYRSLGADNVFNDGDYILFYAQGPVSWSYNSVFGMYLRTRNHYSDKAYYFVGERKEGTLAATLSSVNSAPVKTITSFTDFKLHETEEVNMGESVDAHGTGRDLFGEDFLYKNSQIFKFSAANPDTTVNSKIFVEFAANNLQSTYCNVFVNGQYTNAVSIPANVPYSSNDDYRYAYTSHSSGVFRPAGEQVPVQLDYYKTQTSSRSRAYLDYIVLNMRRFLKMSGATMSFRDPSSVTPGSYGRFRIGNATPGLMVFDVTNPQAMTQVDGTLNGEVYEFTNSISTLHEYVAVESSGVIPKPTVEGVVVNQDLHGQDFVDMVIVSPRAFLTQAQTLADAHASHDGLKVLVVTPEQVYNEFSSGTPDATAVRRMMKLYYDRASTDDEMPDYLLFFGDGTYDNRMVSSSFKRLSNRDNYLLTYQSEESVDGHYSYVTDDYFGFLDDTEGDRLNLDKLDIGIGRFPVATTEEADIVLNKTLNYMYNSRKGPWKNRLLFLADNGDNNIHVSQANVLADNVGSAHPEFMVNKVFIDAYKQVSTASGITVPDANLRFSQLLNEGLLMLNYTGHGSTNQWADEKLLMKQDILKMSNACLPLWVTATCDFSRYDAPDKSGGEMVLLQKNGGGIALLTTTRIVYSYENNTLNTAFLSKIFSKNNGVRYTLGQVMRLSKCTSALDADANKLNFALLGDPALKLGYPEYTAKVTQVNGNEVSTKNDTLKALSTVTISGQVYREDGAPATDYSGLIYPTVLDASEIIAKIPGTGTDTLRISQRSKVLFAGKDSVIAGKFTFTFVVPKDNSYSFKNGRINLYASDSSGLNEAQGAFDRIVLGGTSANLADDTAGPQIRIWLNDERFVSGGTVNATPTLLVKMSDVSGLNTSGSGIGHDLTLQIDEDAERNYILNNYFSTEVGSYQSGTVLYRIPALDEGRHRLIFKAWDVRNNSSSDTVYCIVKKGYSPSIQDVRFAQNGETGQFIFTHDRPSGSVQIRLEIYDLLGRLVWQKETALQAEDNLSGVLSWPLTDLKNRRVLNGMYIVRVRLTDSDGSFTDASQKILVSAQ